MKRTKTKLVSSIVTLLVCFAMLVGSTFAWFTDSASTGVNTIKAGNLDIVLEYYDTNESTWKEVGENTKLFDDNALWEPGHTEVAYLHVENKGSLDLKYKMNVNIPEEKESINQDDVSFKLSDYLVFGKVALENDSSFFVNREDAINAVADNARGLTSWSKAGNLYSDSSEGTTEEYVALVIYMPDDIGNVANHKTDIEAPQIKLGLNLVATQLNSESDSFGTDYDINADGSPDNTDNWNSSAFMAEASEIKSIESLNDTTFTMAIAPANSEISNIKESTTVTFPAGSFNVNDSNAELSVSVNGIESNFDVTIPDDETESTTPVASIDLTVKVDGTEVSNFNEQYVTVETYILKNLDADKVKVSYNGTLIEGSTYDPETGRLTFTTTHFSQYDVLSNAVCYSVKRGKGYSSIIDAANDSKSGDKIQLLSDIDLTNFVDNDDDGNVIAKLKGTLDGSKGNGECYTIKMPESEEIKNFIGEYSSYSTVTVSNIKIVLGNRRSVLSLMNPSWPTSANVIIDNVDYSSSTDNNYYTLGHNSSVYGSYFAYSGSVKFLNCDVDINLDGTPSKSTANNAVFFGGYNFGNTKVTVTDCSYNGEFIGPYVALVISNGQNVTSSNTLVSGLINNGRLFGLLGANAVGGQNPNQNLSFDVQGNGTITKAENSEIVINKDNGQVTFSSSTNSEASSYILQLAGVRRIYNSTGSEYASNYNYDIRFKNIEPNTSTPLYRMIDIDTAKTKYGFTDDDFTDSEWVSTGSYYEGNGEYCVAQKEGVGYYVLRFASSENGDKYSIDTMPTQINVMVSDANGKLIEIKTN